VSQRDVPWLVLGGAGFIGSHIVDLIGARGETCIVVDDLSNGSADRLQADHVQFFVDDAGGERVADWIENRHFRGIVCLAGSAYVPPSVDDPAMDLEANLGLPFRLLEALRRSRTRSPLILASSAAVYGDPGVAPIGDRTPVDPISPYGVSKLAAERYAAVFARLYGVRTASIRLFSVYGPRQRKQVVYDLGRKMLADAGDVEVLGDGTQSRDLVHVTDAARAFLHVAEHGALEGETYNVATGCDVTIREIITGLSGALGVAPCLRFTGSVRPGDPQRWVGAAEELAKIDFHTQVSWKDGVESIARWLLEEGAAVR